MFENVGTNLKSIAKVLWTISIIASILLLIGSIAAYGGVGFILAIIFVPIMLITEYITCAMAYAIGEADENATKTKVACDNIMQKLKITDQSVQNLLNNDKRLEELCEELIKTINTKTSNSIVESEKNVSDALLIDDIVNKLHQYKDLLNLGIITEEKFESLKQNLLLSI